MYVRRPSLPLRLTLAAVAGGLLSAGYSLNPIWWCPWLAPIFLLIASAGGWRGAVVAGAVAGSVAMSGVLAYYVQQNGWAATVLIACLRAFTWAGAAALANAAGRRLPPAVAMLALPALVAGVELVTLLVSPHGAAGSLAHSQMDMIAVIQVAAIGGIPAIVFLLLLPGSLLGLLLAAPVDSAQVRRAGCALVIILGLAILVSLTRLDAVRSGRQLRVTLVATSRYHDIPGDWSAVWRPYRSAIVRSAPRGGLVVLPEKLALLDRAQADQAAADIGAIAKARHMLIVAGLEVRDRNVHRNRAVIAQPDGTVRWYDKQRLVPGWERRITPGATPYRNRVFDTPYGVAICKDMHIPSIARDYAGVAIMIVPAWDFGEDGWMGARMTALRAVENGFSIARSTRDGLSGIYDQSGRPRTERLTGEGMSIISGRIPADAKPTTYAAVGNVFGWICLGLAAAIATWVATHRAADRLQKRQILQQETA